MEISTEIVTRPNGEIYIEDHAKEYGQYLKEDMDVTISFDSFKFSESASLYAILKVTTQEVKLIDVLMDLHNEEIDSVVFHVEEDGYYTVDHLILPNIKWWNNASEEYKDYYNTIYVTDGERVYKANQGELEECELKEVIERNPEGTTISKCHTNLFYLGWLENCYMNYCNQLFDGMLNTCDRGQNKELIQARDIIWMTLNIIEYLVSFKQYLEALRKLEMFNRCGGLCKNPRLKKVSGCGCS